MTTSLTSMREGPGIIQACMDVPRGLARTHSVYETVFDSTIDHSYYKPVHKQITLINPLQL